MKHTLKSRPGLPSTTPSPISRCDTSTFPNINDITKGQLDRGNLCSTELSAAKTSVLSNNVSRLNRCQGWTGDDITSASSFESKDFLSRLVTSKDMQLDALMLKLSKKTIEMESLTESIQLIYSRMRAIDKVSELLKENVIEMNRVLASRQRSVDHLISINTTLIDTLAALGLQPSSDKGLSRQMIRQRLDILPMIKPQIEGVDNVMRINKDDIYAVNGKLKEGLLVMGREYYGSKKGMKAMFGVYEELRSALRVIDQKNR